MKNLLPAIFLIAAAAAGQTPSGAPPQPAATSRKAALPAHPAAATIPAWDELKYPALRPIEVPPVETVTLPNGMRVFLLEDHELPLVNGSARVRTGNLFDPPDKIGLATMTGMVMRTGGTRAKTGDQLNEELENVAATVESSIGETSGSVGFSALKENTDQVLGILHDILTAPEFRPDKIDLAKTQMRSSIARRNDDAHDIVEREFAGTVYGKDTPYGWDEQYATVARIERKDLQEFHRRYFFPANVMLAVWGDFNTADMKAKLEKLFADWTVRQPPVPPFPKVTAKAAPGTFLAVKSDVTQTFFSMGHLGGELRDKDYPALEIMADILGGGFQSRLFQEVRTRMGNAYDIQAGWGANYDHPGLFQISGSTKSLSTVETLDAIKKEVQRIRTAEVSENELKTAQDTALNSLVFAFDTRAKTLGRMLNYEYFGYPRDFIQQYQKALAAVTRADVLRVAKEHLTPANFTVVAVGNPEHFAKPLDTLGGPVTPIDLTIPEPKPEALKVDEQSLAAGRRLLQRAQQAVGGTDKLAGVKDAMWTSETRYDPSVGGMQVKETDRWIAPAHYREDVQLPGRAISVYCDGTSGWVATSQGSGLLTGPQLKQFLGGASRVYFRAVLADRQPGWTVNAVDDGTVEIAAGDQGYRLGFDPNTGLPQRVVYEETAAQGPPQPVEEDYSDFREINGIKIPFHSVILKGGRKFSEVTVNECKINSGLEISVVGKRP